MKFPLLKMLRIGLLPSFLKVIYYRLKGADIGRGVHIGLFSIIEAKKIRIGDGSKIAFCSFISVKELILGKRVKISMMVSVDTGILELDDDVVISEQVIIGGTTTPRSKLTMGKRSKLFAQSIVNPSEHIIIGEDTCIGGCSKIFTHGAWLSVLDGFSVNYSKVVIGNRVWIPWNTFIMPGVNIGDEVIVGPCSLVVSSVPPRTYVSGVPAKQVVSDGRF